jgi:hypothetical protein
MEPRIQYAQTAEGVSIAFWTLGAARPFCTYEALQSAISKWTGSGP